MRHVPEPGHEEWVARMRERARLDAEELVPRPPFPVFGLAAPPLLPAALAEAGQVNGMWETITLAYGDWAEPAGPWVSVTSAVPAGDARGTGGEENEEKLLRSIDQERNRIAAHAGVDEEGPPEPPEYTRADLRAGDDILTGLVCRHGNVWAATVPAGGVSVILVGRGLDPGSVRLGAVADLRPYLRERGEVLGALAERHRQAPPPVLEPAAGVAAFRAVADAALKSQARNAAARDARRVPRHRAGEGAVMHALWQRAVREQQRISGISARQADEIVTLVVNHLTHLHEQAPWFTTEPRLREAAIDETLRHAVLGEDVPSRPAQQAWARYWAHRMSAAGHEPSTDLRAALAGGSQLLPGWLRAWAAWAGTS